MIDSAQLLMSENMMWVYLGIFLAPFVQEDAAVISAASLAATGMGQEAAILGVALAGLSASDLWKYTIGMAARQQAWAKRFAEKPRVEAAGRVVREKLGQAIFAARFVPGTRIALYIAAGYFSAPFWRFAVFIVASAAVLIGGLFALLRVLGDVVGDSAVLIVSLTALSVLMVYVLFKVIRARQRGAT
ncbi:MAG: VTT domain-containing protein [Pseudomonadota bacterium]